MITTPTPTPDASGNDVFLDGDQPGTDNVVSVVAVLCGTDACMTNTWNNVRFVDQTTSTDNTDLGPLYRPDSTNDDSFSDNKADNMENTENQEDHENSSIIPIAIAVPLAAAILAVVGFVLYWRKRKKRNRSSQQDSSYGQLESGGTTPTSLVAADSSQRFPVVRNSSLGRRSNQNYRASGLSSRLSNVDEVGEMQQIHMPQQTSHLPPPLPPDSTRLPPMRSNTHRRRSPPPPPPAIPQRH
ncbi:hypothetical protein H4S08_002686, partial [Coemansia sp. RSA 1365]